MLSPPVPFVDRRVPGGDRRTRPTPMLSGHTILGGRRRVCRRVGEQRGSFVDNHGTFLFLVVTTVAMLNILDAMFTVLFLSYGGREVNPLVLASLNSGIWTFLTLKSVGIGACVVFLTLTKNFRVSRAGLGLVLCGYAVLMSWHTYLYVNLSDFV